MKNLVTDNFDVIIIGSGISGLVCGCYLSKMGKKVLLVEKNLKPGGYCTSFLANGFHFDACAHALSSLRKQGRLYEILEGLGLIDKLNIKRYNPTDIIITPKHKIRIFQEYRKTIKEFQINFPKEKVSIENFFKFILFSPIQKIIILRSKTFDKILNSYFRDPDLKSILSILMLQLTGLRPSKLSAIVACFLWKEFIFDGGYYPTGGMQILSDTLLNRFYQLKGTAIFSKKAKEIIFKNNQAIGIALEDNTRITSKYVVSACDAKQTFLELIKNNKINNLFKKKLSTMVPSSSGFLVYLGLDRFSANLAKFKSNFYVFNESNFNEIYSSYLRNENKHFIMLSSSIRNTSYKDKIDICLATNGIYKNHNHWNYENKNRLADYLINQANNIIPNLSNHIVFKGIATPETLSNWTLNSEGAAYGWASIPEQFRTLQISQDTIIENLYLTGHWSNSSSGITFVACSGYETADLIIKKSRAK